MLNERRVVQYLEIFLTTERVGFGWKIFDINGNTKEDFIKYLYGITEYRTPRKFKGKNKLSKISNLVYDKILNKKIRIVKEDIERCESKGFIKVNPTTKEVLVTSDGRKITGWNPIHLIYFGQKLAEEYGQYTGLIFGIAIAVIPQIIIKFIQ